jgi:hypothetical protein
MMIRAMKKLLAFCLLAPLLPGQVSAQVANPVYFPSYDPFTSAVSSGGSSYATGALLAGQTNALGSYWYGIDSTGTAADSLKLTGGSLNYSNATGFSGNTILLTNVAGPGARMFLATNSAGFLTTGPLSIFYSFVMQVSNINNLTTTTNGYICGFGDQGTIATQTSQPGTVSTRLYLEKVTGGYEVGIGKMASPSYAPTVYTTNQVLFIVADYEIQTSDASGSSKADIVRLWINPATNTFGAPTQPAETVNTGSADTDLTPYTSCFQFYDIANTPNDTYITDFRVGTNWSWVTGGPAIGQQPVPGTNFGGGVLNLTVLALNNGSANFYQWQFDGTNLTDGPSLSGSGANVTNSSTASLTISNLTSLDAGSYSVVVSNSYGVVTSAVSAVTTYTIPIIIVQPAPTNILLYAGQSNTISLTAIGAPPLMYYWYSNNTLIAAMTNASFVITNLEAAANIYCVVSNSLNTATSALVSLTAVSLPTSPYPLAVYNDHPIGFWPLNEGPDNTNGDDGTTAHDYIAANNGFFSNVFLDLPGYGEGLTNEYGYAPPTDTNTSTQFGDFTYPNSYVAQIPNINFASSGAGGSSFSVEAWANANGSGQTSGAAIVGKGYGGGGEQFTMDYTTGWRFYVREAGGTAVTALTSSTVDDNWHHLVGVLDTVHSNITMYVDGVAQSSTLYTPSTGILSTAFPVTIGSRMSSATSAFNDNFFGTIQDVAIYNYALSAAQVANHYYKAGIGPSITSLPNVTNVNEGTTLIVSPVVGGTPVLSYQWYDVFSGIPGPATALAGQTNATLVISNISAATYNGHPFELIVTNIYGQASGIISVIVQSGPPASVAITPSSLALYAGLVAPFTVSAQNTAPFSYQWSTNGGNVAGATNSFYHANLPPGSYTIGCAVTNADGPSSPPVVTASLTVVAAPTDNYATTILKDDPIAFWRLDEPTNAITAFDYVGNHEATYNNAINGQPGFSPIYIPSETATVFGSNGIANSEAVENNNSANGIPLIDFSTQGANAEFSVELWVRLPAPSADLICKGYPNNTQFAFDCDGTDSAFRFIVHNSADTIETASTVTVADGNWHHLVGVCDEANGAVYVYCDGSRQSTATIPEGSGLLSLSPTYLVAIAAQESSGGSGYVNSTDASISQVALYAYAMTSNQVAAHYKAATSLPQLPPFSITSWTYLDGTSMTLNWLSAPNYTYQVQVASALAGGTNDWKNIGSPIMATGTNTTYTDTSTNASGQTGFYRVIGY